MPSSPVRRTSDGAFAIASLSVLALGCGLITASANLPFLNLATLAAFGMLGLVLAFARAAGVRRGSVGGPLLFVGVYSLTEWSEGRTRGSELLVAIVLLFAGLTIWGILQRIYASYETPAERRLAFGSAFLIPLLVLLASYSGASGGAGGMTPWFSWLPDDVAWAIVVTIRKLIHSTYYPLLALSALAAFTRTRPDLRANAPWALGLAAIFAIFDELRQSLIPGRTGSGWDVLLDLVAATIVLALVIRRASAKSEPDGEPQ